MEIKVYETNDYQIFKKLRGNRDLKSVNKIVESINRVGYIPSPICVNENMEVIDGQNRVVALEQLGLPVHYYIVEGAGLEEARQMNIGRKDWTPLDYVHSYALDGNENYKRLLGVLNNYREYPLQEIVGICKNTPITTGWLTASLKTGDFVLTEQEVKSVDMVMEYLDELKDAIKRYTALSKGPKRLTVTCLAWILRANGVNPVRVIDIFNKKYSLFDPSTTAEQFIKNFSDFYNKRLKDEIWLDVEYRKWLASK